MAAIINETWLLLTTLALLFAWGGCWFGIGAGAAVFGLVWLANKVMEL